MPRFVLLLTLLLGTPFAASAAQTKDQDRWQITLESGDYIWDIRLVRLDGDKIVFRQADTLGTVGVAVITELRLIRKTEARLGEGMAAAAINALTGADDEVYDLTPMDYAGRLRAVQQIFLMHPPGQP
jgi:hypothetical protein